MSLAAAATDPRRRRWRAAAAWACAVLVFAAASVVTFNGGGRGRVKPSEGAQEPSIKPLATNPADAVPPAPFNATADGASVAELLPPTPDASATTVPTKATAAGMSTHDALSNVMAAISAAAAQQQQQQQQQTDGEGGAGDEEGPCRAWTSDELTHAVENGLCDLIMVPNPHPDAYVLSREISVTRRVTVMGNPAYLPSINAGAGGAVRAFHVLAGGFLDLRFVRVHQGAGIVRERYGLENAESLSIKVVEIRGGSVAIERGALGASFLGVTFLALANTPEAVQAAIAATFEGTGGRVYGGHVFVAEGDVEFVACNFWDTTLVLPLTDQVIIGGDILLVGGSCRVTASTFTVTAVFNNVALTGGCVAVLAGTVVITWSLEQSQSVFTSANGPGQIFWVGGGILIITGFDFRLVCGALLFTGFGDFGVGGGVLIMTAVEIVNSYALLFATGCGFYTAVGAGVLVQTGVAYSQQNGPAMNALAGGSVFVGTGASINTGCPSNFFLSTGAFAGIGSFSYNGAGVSTWVGCPYASYAATLSFNGAGAVTAQSAGWLTWVGCPVFAPTGLLYFAGLGNVLYESTGAAVIVRSPVYAPAALAYTQGNGANFVVGQQSFNKGKGATYVGGKTLAGTGANANASRRAVRELGPRVRAGKRYLKGQPAVPFPWAAFHDADEPAAGVAAARVLMAQTRSFDRIDFADVAAGWGVSDEMVVVAQAVEGLRLDVQRVLAGNTSLPPRSRDSSHHHHRRRRRASSSKQQERATLYVGEDVDYCGACGVDSISGPRASMCETDCAAVQAKIPEVSFDYGQVQFEPTHLVLTTIEAPVPAASMADSGAVAALAMDVRDALRLWLHLPLVDLPDVQVTVYPADAGKGDELIRRWLRGEEDAGPAAAASTERSASPCRFRRLRLTAAFVAHDAEAAALLQSVADKEREQEQEQEQGGSSTNMTAAAASTPAREALLGGVQGALQTGQAEKNENGCVKGNAATTMTPSIHFQRAFFLPAYDSPEFLQEQQQQQVELSSTATHHTNSIRLVDPLRPGVPLGAAGMGAHQDVVLGRTYRVELAGFPPRVSVLVALVPVLNEELEPRALMTLRTDGRGAARSLWTVPRTQPPGQYYLQAVPPGGEDGGEQASSSIWGLSPLYAVTTRPRRQRKLGPVLEL